MTIHPHSVTDDTEMTIQLLKSILNFGTYNVDDVINNYLKWANLKGGAGLGKNTRKLMKGITTVKYFRKRQEKFDTSTVENNGSLMRCFPLSLLSDWQDKSNVDATLTNNNDVNRECSLVYLNIIRYIIFGDNLSVTITQGSIKNAINQAINNIIVDVSVNKSWIIHALYVSLITFLNTTNYETGMDFIAKHFIKGDTDTIMAITGGLIGSFYGFTSMIKESNTSINITKIGDWMNKTDRPHFDNDMTTKIKEFVKRQTELISLVHHRSSKDHIKSYLLKISE